jgi:PilZ domain
MTGRERRTAPRKICGLPLRFRVSANGRNDQAAGIETRYEMQQAGTSAHAAEFEGEALNVSERGVYFTCREKLRIGQPIEIYLTLPKELTGRAPENVRCSARVVHVDEGGQAGLRGIGACVDQFEPVTAVRNWAN